MEIKSQKIKGRALTGVVVSAKMKNTAVVEVSRFIKHPKYQKYLKHSKRVKADDPGNTKREGERITIVECRPLSKEKRFRVV